MPILHQRTAQKVSFIDFSNFFIADYPKKLLFVRFYFGRTKKATFFVHFQISSSPMTPKSCFFVRFYFGRTKKTFFLVHFQISSSLMTPNGSAEVKRTKKQLFGVISDEKFENGQKSCFFGSTEVKTDKKTNFLGSSASKKFENGPKKLGFWFGRSKNGQKLMLRDY